MPQLAPQLSRQGDGWTPRPLHTAVGRPPGNGLLLLVLPFEGVLLAHPSVHLLPFAPGRGSTLVRGCRPAAVTRPSTRAFDSGWQGPERAGSAPAPAQLGHLTYSMNCPSGMSMSSWLRCLAMLREMQREPSALGELTMPQSRSGSTNSRSGRPHLAQGNRAEGGLVGSWRCWAVHGPQHRAAHPLRRALQHCRGRGCGQGWVCLICGECGVVWCGAEGGAAPSNLPIPTAAPSPAAPP